MGRKLTILFAPIDAFSHFNVSIGIAERLRDRGHKIIFAIDRAWNGKLKKYGFIEELMIIPISSENNKPEEPGKMWADVLLNAGVFDEYSSLEKLKARVKPGIIETFMDKTKAFNPFYKEIVERVKPDIIIIDNNS